MAIFASIYANAYDFDAINAEGITIYYNILSDTDKTVSVTSPYGVSGNYKGSINIPEKVIYSTVTYTVTMINGTAFSSCSNLTSVDIPNSVTSIGEQAFWKCSGLTSITIPNSVTSIGWGAFYGCTGLTSVILPNSITSISYDTFGGCFGLTSVTIPNSVTSIGSRAFNGCTGLRAHPTKNVKREVANF